MSEDALVVARRLRDKAQTPGTREYWRRVCEGIERSRAEEKK